TPMTTLLTPYTTLCVCLSSRRRHTTSKRDWSSDVCSSDLELIRVQGLEPEQVTAYHIGFVLGPCLNASGRLDTAERSLALLLARSEERRVGKERRSRG